MLTGLRALSTAPLGCVPDLLAARHPRATLRSDRPEPVLGGRRSVGYPDYAAAVRRTAAVLGAAGIGPGDVVAVSVQDGLGVHALVHGLWGRGAVPALISPRLEPAGALKLLHRLRPHGMVTDGATLTRYDDVVASIESELSRPVLVIEGTQWRQTPARSQWRADTAADLPVSPPQWDQERPALVTHTSGTTRTEPRLVVHRERSVRLQTQLQVGGAGLLLPDVRSYAVATSASHSRSITGLLSSMTLGWDVSLVNDVRPEHALHTIGIQGPDLLESYPNVLLLWETGTEDLSRYLARTRVFFSTYDAVHPRTVARLLQASRRRLPLYLQGYGQSEVGPISARVYTRWSARRGAHRDGRCVGWPVPGFTGHRVTAANGRRQLDPRRTGDVQVRTRAIAAGYLDGGDLFDQCELGEWFGPGDVGRRNPWGCLHLLERGVDAVAGVPSTLAAEDVLLGQVPDLTEVIVLAADGGALPVVSTASGRPPDAAAWRRAVRDLPVMLPPLTIPWDSFPRTATYKVKRAALAGSLRANGPLPTEGVR